MGGDNLPKVYLFHGDLTDKEMNALINHDKVKVHISFTHGEGAGNPLLLATLSGKPLLVSNWSGHLDFLNPEYANLLRGDVKPISPESVNEWLIRESSWFYVDYFNAQEKMIGAIEKYDKLLEKAEKLRLENVEKFNIQVMTTKFHDLLDKYLPKFAIEQPIKLPQINKIKLNNPVKTQ